MNELAQQIEDIMDEINSLDDIMETAIAEDDLEKAKTTLAVLQGLELILESKIDKLEEMLKA